MQAPKLEILVEQVASVNQAWKVACEIWGNDSGLAISLREMKTRLQVRILRNYAPFQVYLMLDKEAETNEPVYGIKLVNKIKGFQDAAHLPVRVAKEVLSEQEISNFFAKK